VRLAKTAAQYRRGKPVAAQRIEATLGTRLTKNRLAIHDRNSAIKFLVDTGADISVLPRSSLTRNTKPVDLKIYATNGSVINTYGDRTLTLNLGLRRPFTWRFLLADVQQAILGADFLNNFNLLVDLRGRRIIDGTTELFTTGRVTQCRTPSLSIIKYDNPYKELLAIHRSYQISKGANTETLSSALRNHPRTSSSRASAPTLTDPRKSRAKRNGGINGARHLRTLF